MKVCGFIVVLGLALLITPVPASAQPVPVPDSWRQMLPQWPETE